MAYRVMVDDNFHFMDEDERTCAGTFDTWEEAVAQAQSIVRSFFGRPGQENETADELFDDYTTFGEDPFILVDKDSIPPIQGYRDGFNAWGYARQICDALAAQNKPKNAGD